MWCKISAKISRDTMRLLPVSDTKSITKVLDAMLGSETELKRVGEAGKEVWKRYTGATERVLLGLIRR